MFTRSLDGDTVGIPVIIEPIEITMPGFDEDLWEWILEVLEEQKDVIIEGGVYSKDFVLGMMTSLAQNTVEGPLLIGTQMLQITDTMLGGNFVDDFQRMFNECHGDIEWLITQLAESDMITNQEAFYLGRVTGDVCSMVIGIVGMAVGVATIASGLTSVGGGLPALSSAVPYPAGVIQIAVGAALVAEGAAVLAMECGKVKTRILLLIYPLNLPKNLREVASVRDNTLLMESLWTYMFIGRLEMGLKSFILKLLGENGSLIIADGTRPFFGYFKLKDNKLYYKLSIQENTGYEEIVFEKIEDYPLPEDE